MYIYISNIYIYIYIYIYISDKFPVYPQKALAMCKPSPPNDPLALKTDS